MNKRVKCKSDFVTVFPPGGGNYPRRIPEVTVGNVYEVVSVKRCDNYEILPDKGLRTIELPTYMFSPTTEPVTVNRDREKEEKARQDGNEKDRLERLERGRKQRISDSMDQFYDPDNFRKKTESHLRVVRALSNIFVQGISYDN